MRRVATSWQVIESVLKEHAHSVYRALRGPARARDIAAAEKAIGRRLPTGLAASLRVHDGMTDRTDLVDFMSLLSADRIAFW